MRDWDELGGQRFDAAASECSAATQRGRAQFFQRSQSESNARAWPQNGAAVFGTARSVLQLDAAPCW